MSNIDISSWRKFRVGDLFEKVDLKWKGNRKFVKSLDISKVQSKEFSLPLVNAKNGDNGIMYYGRVEDWESAKMCLDIVNDGAVSAGNVYPQSQLTGVLYNAYLVKPLYKDINTEILLFLSCCLEKNIKHKYSYDNKATWEKVKNDYVFLPAKEEDVPDWDYMAERIRELEAERIRELEAERIRELEAYFVASGLDDYELTEADKQVLAEMSTGGGNSDSLGCNEDVGGLRWKEFKIVNIFDVYNTKSILKEQVVPNSGSVPYITASEANNAVMTYIDCPKEWVDKGNCVFIGGKTMVVTYQKDDFCSNDSHNLALYLREQNVSEHVYFYLVAAIKKALGYKYVWGDSISWKKIQIDCFKLPIKEDDTPDFDFMERYIRAIEKVTIADAVKWKDKQIGIAKQLII